tara:strand:- start:163 stop:2379 length:2217 start_codon:yes stop_codon:yes gene_type:complete
MTMTIQKFREIKPEYFDIPDDELINKIQNKFNKPFKDVTDEDLGISNIKNITEEEIKEVEQPKAVDTTDVLLKIPIPSYRGGGSTAEITKQDLKAFGKKWWSEAPLGGGDELEAFAKSTLGDNNYKKELAEVTKEIEQYEQANPTAVKWGEVAGMLTSAGPLSIPFKYFDKLPKLQRFLAKTGFFGATGATYGGLKAKEGEAAEKTLVGGAIGTAIQPALSTLGMAGRLGANVIMSAVNKIRGAKPLSSAEKKLSASISDDAQNPSTIMANVSKGLDADSTIVEAAGKNTQDIARLIGKASGEGRQIYTKFLEQRNEKVGERLLNQAKRLFNTQDGNVKSWTDALNKQKEKASEVYKTLDKKLIRKTTSINDMLNNKAAQKFIKEARDIAELEGQDLQNLKFLDDILYTTEQGLAGKQNSITFKTADNIKKGIDEAIESFRDKTTGKLNKRSPKVKALLAYKERWTKLIDQQLPDYKKARAMYQGPAEQLEAQKLGEAFLLGKGKTEPELFESVLDGFSKDQQLAFMRGATIAIDKMIANRMNASAVVNKILKTPVYRKALQTIFSKVNQDGSRSISQGAKNDLDRMFRYLQSEANNASQANKVLGGSPTAEIIRQGQELGLDPELAKNVAYVFGGSAIGRIIGATGLAGTAVEKVTQTVIDKARNIPLSANVRKELAEIFTETDPIKINQILNRVIPKIDSKDTLARKELINSLRNLRDSVLSTQGTNRLSDALLNR